MSLDAESAAILQKLLLGLLAVLAVGNALVFASWLTGYIRGRPVLAPAWSAADVFIGFQLVVAIILTAGCFVSVFAAVLAPRGVRGDPDALSGAIMSTALVPLMLVQQAALVSVPLAFVRIRYREPSAALGFPARDAAFWRQVGFGAILALALLPVNDLIEVLARHWVLDSGWFPMADVMRTLSEQMNAVRVLDEVRHRPAVLAGLVVIIGVIGPISEEVFFRGFAYTAFKKRFGVTPAVLLSALVFAAVHGSPVALIPIFFIGIVLAAIFERTGSLAAPIGLHCANNSAVVALYFLSPDFTLWGWLFK
ncbi:MAG: CPBP family intramembrane glutamic endopeptidase [Actinomycetota bacterium]